jgi:hypothetical protein
MCVSNISNFTPTRGPKASACVLALGVALGLPVAASAQDGAHFTACFAGSGFGSANESPRSVRHWYTSPSIDFGGTDLKLYDAVVKEWQAFVPTIEAKDKLTWFGCSGRMTQTGTEIWLTRNGPNEGIIRHRLDWQPSSVKPQGPCNPTPSITPTALRPGTATTAHRSS